MPTNAHQAQNLRWIVKGEWHAFIVVIKGKVWGDFFKIFFGHRTAPKLSQPIIGDLWTTDNQKQCLL